MVPHYKHFSLEQRSQTHHKFKLILDHDTFGIYENHQLETPNKFLGNRLTVVICYKEIEDGPEQTFVGEITKVDIYRNIQVLEILFYQDLVPLFY